MKKVNESSETRENEDSSDNTQDRIKHFHPPVLRPVSKQVIQDETDINHTLGQDSSNGWFVKDVYLPKQTKFVDRFQPKKNPTSTLQSTEDLDKELLEANQTAGTFLSLKTGKGLLINYVTQF